MQSNVRIAVVGGGPGGLTLARVLLVHGLRATVFESEPRAPSRSQGGSLDLHDDSGLVALREAGLDEGFRRVARYDDQDAKILDPSGAVHHADSDPGGGRPEIDRTQLRDLLLASLPDELVRWNAPIERVEPNADGTYAVITPAGREGPFDLVVGADGAWSKVRPLLTDERPAYAGVTFFELSIDDVDARHPELAAILGRGKIFACGVDRTLVAQRSSGSHVRVYVALRVPESFGRAEVDRSSPAALKRALLEQLAGFAPTLLRFVTEASDVIAPRSIVALPIGFRWAPRAGVTLLGDAAHVMSPFAGEGVNLAMLDATKLALALVAGADDWRAAVRGYEEDMFERVRPSAEASAMGLDAFVAPDALERAVAIMRGHAEPR